NDNKVSPQLTTFEKVRLEIRGYQGSRYFLENQEWSREGYVNYRPQFAYQNPSATAKQYNQLMDYFRRCNSPTHKDFASANKAKMTKKWVMSLHSKHPGIEVKGNGNDILIDLSLRHNKGSITTF
ncbi:hypothetical protein BGZ76_002694, partial [Entomortierella beljakovae]